ncbi:YbaY family lipoprotein [Sphingomonas sp. BT-65]|uniref:YbaY family lipoprotein n=1 Tax=Sphingomonas sp. BT-65 TaxID=2989821 RepID=UPI0022368AD9|nr:YbaY family lipoprotein [Sphingomonas sp. BT-65]MCW4463313.1 YbaY family lipoprotein [Sphingomonas sp. BT-65]
MRLLPLVPLLAGLAACATVPEPGAATLTGTVTYRERIALPPDSRVIVTISDVSLADAPSVTIAQNQIVTAGQQVPISFALSYDRARIEPGRSYAVSARILDGRGRLAWITDTRNALPPPGQSIELWLVQARR